MFVVSNTDNSPTFILMLNMVQEKQKKYTVIYSDVHEDVVNFEVCRFMEKTKF